MTPIGGTISHEVAIDTEGGRTTRSCVDDTAMNLSSGESSSQDTTTTTAATNERPRRRGAGNELPALLEALQEDSLSEDVEAAVSVEASGGDNGGSHKVQLKRREANVSGAIKLLSCDAKT